jgi:hypothetical protein
MKRVLGLGLLILGTACRWGGTPARERIFAPREAGLTLQYENPELADGKRLDERLQVRVAETRPVEGGLAVQVAYASLHGALSTQYFLPAGGGLYLCPDGRMPGILVFPAGFPDAVTRWEVRGMKYRVLGRAVADLHGLRLPETSDRVGVWVETESPAGQRQRTFFLPDIGEVETLSWRDGAWVSVNRLVSRGFTDAPGLKTETPLASGARQ